MLEVFLEAIRPINLPLTVLLSIVVLYWILVALGALGLDFDADADLNGEADGHAGDLDSEWTSQILGFINIGEVPLTIVLSVLTLCLWVLSIIANYYWTGGSMILGMALLIPNLLISAVLTRYITMPFRPLLRALDKDGEEHLPMVGRTCQITTSEATTHFGQAQIDRKGAPILINVRTLETPPLSRGSTALIVRQDPKKDVFYVIPVSPDKLT